MSARVAALTVILAWCFGCGTPEPTPHADRICPGGETACGSSCVDRMTSGEHCGACGNRCTDGATCVDGACELQCDGGTEACGEEWVVLARRPDDTAEQGRATEGEA